MGIEVGMFPATQITFLFDIFSNLLDFIQWRKLIRKDIPPPQMSGLMEVKCISTCNNISATSLTGTQKPSKVTSESLKLTLF